jgi:chemotaxis protein histidine kinase CheA/ActR/RegA family two-component response regulator
MQLEDFLAALKGEIELAQADLAGYGQALALAAPGSDAAQAAVDAYGAQVERLAGTCQMLGMAGLGDACTEVMGALATVAQAEGDARLNGALMLDMWPPLFMAWLDAPADAAVAGAIIETFAAPEWPHPIEDARQQALLGLLLLPPELPAELVEEAALASAPIVISPEDVSLAIPEDSDPDVYNAFIDEAPDKATELSALMTRLSNGDAGEEELRNAKRIAHSFKGSANIVGIRGIASIAHHTEDILEYLETSGARAPQAMAATLMDSAATMEQMVYALLGVEEPPTDAWPVLQQVVAWAEKIKQGEIGDDDQIEIIEREVASQSAPMESAAATEIALTPTASFAREPDGLVRDAPPASAPRAASQPSKAAAAPATGEAGPSLKVPTRTVDDLFRLVSELTIKVGQLETRLKSTQNRSKAILNHNLNVQKRVYEMENLVMIRGLSLDRARSHGESLDPLELDRYNELHGATRALVEASADAREIGMSLSDELAALQGEILQQGRLNKEMQHLVMSTRMTPVHSLAPRLTRNIRQTAQTVGKKAELVIHGGDILVDGDVLSSLADPLLHILRNAVDHGIETPEERTAAGKAETGIVELSFIRQGSSVIVRVRDDGRGLDYERIRAKGISRGLLPAEASPSEHELARLTLLPGFSTRDQVSEVSGRGVGMDVVAARMQAMKGSVDIRSVTGDGCEVSLRFQASMVTQHSLIIDVAGQRYAVPSHLIEQALAPGLAEFSLAGSEWTLRLGQKVHRVYTLSALMGIAAPLNDAESLAAKPVLITQLADRPAAVVVDAVVDSRDLIVKGLSRYLARARGVSGTAVLGDGAIAPLLDLNALVEAPQALRVGSSVPALAGTMMQARKVLVVDDSLSVRKSLTQLLQDFAYEVHAAGDGIEAIRALEKFSPQLVLTDLEMPNMNGVELTEYLRRNEATRALPIIMITSRSMDKHRDMARQAGVDLYVTKPYTEGDLLRHIHTLMEAQPA